MLMEIASHMMKPEEVRKIAMSFPGATEAPHFEKISFRTPKKIFLTMDTANSTATIKLTVEDQSLFSSSPDGSIFPVPNAWGKQGWTKIDLKKVKKSLFKDAVQCSWATVSVRSKR